MNRRNLTALATLGLALAASPLPAGNNIDVSTLPGRESVQLTIYNSEDLTLVRETRRITFRKGMNPLQFSWANTLIDPSSVEVRFTSHAEKLDVLDTTFPHDKPQMLYWNVRSAIDGDALVEITYFTSGVTWAADYVCIADAAEKAIRFEGHVTVINGSGEDYEGAQVRLVVGTINLVEKVAELARRGLVSSAELEGYQRGDRRARDLEKDEARSEVYKMAGRAMAQAPAAPKEIIKEGLSEYFIFTVEGAESVANGWSKRMRLFEGLKVPFEIKYRYRPQEYGDQLMRLYVLRNDTKSRLGSTPLPDGMVRAFRDTGRDGLSFLVASPVKYVPIGQEIELKLGPDPSVVHERVLLRSWRDNFWFQGRLPNVYFSPTQGHVIEPNHSVAGWEDHERWIERIRNDRDAPIEVEIRRSYPGDVTFQSRLDKSLYDFRTPQVTARIEPRSRRDLGYELTMKQGYLKKQDSVTLKDG
jgi:hypothetical protein